MTGADELADTDLCLASRLCVVAGSRDPITLRQIDHLVAARSDARRFLAPNGCVSEPAQEVDRLTILQAVAGEAPASGGEVSARLARSLIRLRVEAETTILLTGGATAEAVLDARGIDHLELLGEVAPGLPVCRADRGVFITKSGGFGTAGTLAEIADTICGM